MNQQQAKSTIVDITKPFPINEVSTIMEQYLHCDHFDADMFNYGDEDDDEDSDSDYEESNYNSGDDSDTESEIDYQPLEPKQLTYKRDHPTWHSRDPKSHTTRPQKQSRLKEDHKTSIPSTQSTKQKEVPRYRGSHSSDV